MSLAPTLFTHILPKTTILIIEPNPMLLYWLIIWSKMTIFNIGQMVDKCVIYVLLLQYLSKMEKNANPQHYSEVSVMEAQITDNSTVYSTACSGLLRKTQNSTLSTLCIGKSAGEASEDSLTKSQQCGKRFHVISLPRCVRIWYNNRHGNG